MDTIAGKFAADADLGIVFAEDPYLSGWDANLPIAHDLAARLGIDTPLPKFFEFPNGAMFWARSSALKPLLDAAFAWTDYPEEPLPYDGTMLHALERLFPFVCAKTGHRFATTQVAGITR
jgi:lipopolysaccharide biosynthesis protein